MRLSGTKLSSIHQYRGLGNQLWDLAGSRPSLDLRFADNKSLVDATTGQNLVTFSRASGGTYTDSQGVIRNAVTNLLLRSEEFDDASWVKVRASVTANAVTAPNGTLTADKLVEDTQTGGHYLSQQISATAGVNYTLSCYLKKGERDIAAIAVLGASNAIVYFDLDAGTIADQSDVDVVNASISDAGNGWYKCSVTAVSASTINSWVMVVQNIVSGTFPSDTGDGTSGIYLWGAQLEQSSTVGEYVPTGATINSAPRFDHDPTTGESLGLLVEDSRENLITASEDIAGYFTEQNSTPTANASTAPDGTTSADLIVPDTTLASHASFNTSLSFAVSTVYSYSIFAKPNGYNWLQLLFTSGFGNSPAWVNFNLTGAGSFGFTGGGELSKSIQAYPSGWYRCTITATSGSSVSAGGPAYLVLDSDRNARSANYAGNNTSGIYLWGAQLEAGAFPTSYIPTEGTTVTRAADVASISGSNFSSWYRQDEGTVFVESSTFAPTSTFDAVATIGSSTVALIASLQRNDTNSRAFGDGVSIDQGGGTFPINVAVKQSLGFKVNDFSLVTNGSTPAIDSSTNPLPVAEHIYIGSNVSSVAILNSHTRRLVYWGQRLPNNVLQSITQ